MKKLILWLFGLTLLGVGTAFAASSGMTVATVATNVTGTMTATAKLITALSYVIGMGMTVAAIIKFKAYKDAPTQVPLGTPIAMLFIGAALIFIPTIFKIGGGTLFGNSGFVAGPSGIAKFGASTPPSS